MRDSCVESPLSPLQIMLDFFSSKLTSQILLYNQVHVCGVRQMLSDTIRVHAGECGGRVKVVIEIYENPLRAFMSFVVL